MMAEAVVCVSSVQRTWRPLHPHRLTLAATLNVLDGTVIDRNMLRPRHQEFIRFLNAIESEVPAGKFVHVILDNYIVHSVSGWANGSPAKDASHSISRRLLAPISKPPSTLRRRH